MKKRKENLDEQLEAQKRIDELISEINRNNRLYYVANQPQISDYDYDLLFKELLELERKFPQFIRKDSPTKKVGAVEEKHKPIKHLYPMLSLDNTYSPGELIEFDRRIKEVIAKPQYEVEPKIDGVAVSIVYRNGKFIEAATRGDGVTGEDVTRNVLTIMELPHVLKDKKLSQGELHLRGEVYISKKKFAEIIEGMIEAGQTPFANPRNTAAGTLKLLNSKEAERRGLRIFIHSYAGRNENQFEFMNRLEEANIPVVPDRTLYSSIESLADDLSKKEMKRHSYHFETDGLVIKLDSSESRNKLGEKSHSPRWAIAYKFPPETAETKLLSIELQVGRTGVITPVAKLEAVKLSGTTVSSATLHNEDEIRRLDIRAGDTVVVQKAGEIIPQIIRCIPAKKRGIAFQMPEICPECGSKLVRDEGKIKLRCSSKNCRAVLKARILHFGSRTAMEIDGLGESTIDMLIEARLIEDVSDIYKLTVGQVAELPRMAEKSAANLINAIMQSKERPLARFIFALGIPGIGEATARDLAEHFGTMKALLDANIEDLMKVNEIGETLAGTICTFFRDEDNAKLLTKLESYGLKAFSDSVIVKKTGENNGLLLGKKVVVTGSIPGFDRRAVEDAVRKMGGRTQSGVSAKTDILILGQEPGSKYNDALQLGVEIMEYENFLKMMNDKKQQ